MWIPKKSMRLNNRLNVLHHVIYPSRVGIRCCSARRIPKQCKVLQQRNESGTEPFSHSRYMLRSLRRSVPCVVQYPPLMLWNHSSERTFSTSEEGLVSNNPKDAPNSNAPTMGHSSSATSLSDPGMITNVATTTDILELLNQTAQYPLGSFGKGEYIRARNYFFLFSLERTPTTIYSSLQERVQKETASPTSDLVNAIFFPNRGAKETKDTFVVTDTLNPSKARRTGKQYKFHVLDSTTHDRIAIGLRLLERLLHELRHACTTPPATAIDPSTEKAASTAAVTEASDMLSPAEIAAKWILDPFQTLHPLLSEWKEEFLQRQQPRKDRRDPNASHTVLPASTIVATLQRCYEIYRPFQCWNDPKTVKIILDMVIRQTPDRAAAAVEADRFVSYVQHQQHNLYLKIQSNEFPKSRALHKYPTKDMYRQLLHVWVNSGQTVKALQRVRGLMKDMHQRLEIRPPIMYYNALLKLHAQSEMSYHEQAPTEPGASGSIYGREHRNKVDTILLSIANEASLQPNLETWFRAVQCYSKWHCFYEAQDIVLKQMIPIVSTAPVDVPLEFEDQTEGDNNSKEQSTTVVSSELLDRACEHILLGYRRLLNLPIKRDIMNRDEKFYLLNQATLFVSQVQRTNLISTKALERIHGTLMDLHAREGNVALATAVFHQMEAPNAIQYCLLIKAYGVHGQPEKAEHLVQHMLREESKVDPNLTIFNTLLNAWAINPSLPDAPNRALSIIRFMDHDLKCIQLGLQPDVVSFNTVLKCLAASTPEANLTPTLGAVSVTDINSRSPNEVGQFAENILNEMMERFRNGNRKVLPDEITYNTCIKACANVGDESRVEAFLSRMKQAGVSPNLRTYNNIFLLYSQLGTVDAAQKAEQLLLDLKEKSKRNPSLTPDVYSYNLLFRAMENSGDSQMHQKIWPMYQAMRQVDGIQPDLVMYTFLILVLTKLDGKEYLEHATALLEEMIQKYTLNVHLRPDHRHYMAVVDAWVDRDIRTASSIFLRFVHNYLKGRTGHDPPKQESMHKIIGEWIKVGDLNEATKFLERLESFSAPKAKKGDKILADGPGVECYRDLLTAWVASSSEKSGYSPQIRDENIAKLRSKLRVMLNVIEDKDVV